MKLLIGIVAMACACVPMGSTGGALKSVSPDTARQCADACVAMNLRMQAVVVVANRTGCVCQVPESAGPSAGGSSGAVQAVVAQLDEEESASQVQEQQLQEEQQS